ncbi:unnamed protein product [Kluyveromyces dobzhanskii CBS 2104]|uniref:WGS project CCBQ000000000 data, contig 00016 n=1 Tax=Kluyveromyces dobzhanskii CBS 2104 TaxID=1427455 RepID=A0A0A8L244_9SACH|nr:unnamed protein product [Kluyveromyces dobzhanskii CBS 2104]
MANEVRKRTKPCISCKLSKVKCEYTDVLPCKRCLKVGIHCQFALNSRSVPVQQPVQLPVQLTGPAPLSGSPPPPIQVPASIPTNGNVKHSSLPSDRISIPPVQPNLNQPDSSGVLSNGRQTEPQVHLNGNYDPMTHNIDNRLNNFESILETMLSTLYKNNLEQQTRIGEMQKELNSQAKITQNLISSQQNSRHRSVRLPNLSQLEQSLDLSQGQQFSQQVPDRPCLAPILSNGAISQVMAPQNPTKDEIVTDYRTADVITKEEAKILLDYFIEHFEPHLYGFTFDGINLESLWHDSPLLLVSICTVACCHHPELDHKFEALHSSLHWFASQLLLPTHGKLNVEHTILGLIIASFWLSSNKMFNSLALQLARNWRIDQLYSPQFERLWYLLYILDGSENLTTHKSPSVYKDMEPLIKDSRRVVIERLDNTTSEGQFFRKALLEYNQRKKHTATHKQLELLNEVRSEKLELNNNTLQDLRLLTQLEYHMAMESVFHNKNTHIPSLHGQSLEATMTLLPTEKFGIPWTNNMDLDKWMISWTIALQNIKVQNDPWCFKSTLLYYNFARMHINTKALLQGKKSTLLDELENVELIKLWHADSRCSKIKDLADSTELSATKEISRSSAIALLKLATEDKDITRIFQFFPTHIYVMLYYASLIVLNPSMVAEISEKDAKQSYTLVTKLKKMLYTATISDKALKNNLVKSLYQLLLSFKQHLAAVDENSQKVYELLDQNEEKESKNKQGRRPILAWPGTNPGHP